MDMDIELYRTLFHGIVNLNAFIHLASTNKYLRKLSNENRSMNSTITQMKKHFVGISKYITTASFSKHNIVNCLSQTLKLTKNVLGNKVSYSFPIFYNASFCHFYKNPRFNTVIPRKYVKSIKLCNGTTTTISGDVLNVLRYIYDMTDETIIPFHCFTSKQSLTDIYLGTSIYVEFNNNFDHSNVDILVDDFVAQKHNTMSVPYLVTNVRQMSGYNKNGIVHIHNKCTHIILKTYSNLSNFHLFHTNYCHNTALFTEIELPLEYSYTKYDYLVIPFCKEITDNKLSFINPDRKTNYIICWNNNVIVEDIFIITVESSTFYF